MFLLTYPRVIFLERKGDYEPLLILNYSKAYDDKHTAGVSFSRIVKVSWAKEKEVEIAEISGKRGGDLLTEIQESYARAKRPTLTRTNRGLLNERLLITLEYGGKWSTAKLNWGQEAHYVEFFADNTSASFRVIPITDLPTELRQYLAH